MLYPITRTSWSQSHRSAIAAWWHWCHSAGIPEVSIVQQWRIREIVGEVFGLNDAQATTPDQAATSICKIGLIRSYKRHQSPPSLSYLHELLEDGPVVIELNYTKGMRPSLCTKGVIQLGLFTQHRRTLNCFGSSDQGIHLQDSYGCSMFGYDGTFIIPYELMGIVLPHAQLYTAKPNPDYTNHRKLRDAKRKNENA